MAKLFGSRDKSSKKQENIPDELPPLADETVVKKEEKVEETPKIEPVEPTKPEEPTKTAELDTKKDETLAEPPPLKNTDKNNSVESTEAPDELPNFEEENDKVDKLNDKADKINAEGFFSDILNITKKQGVNKDFLEKNLYQGMKNYHSSENSVNFKPITKKEIDADVISKLGELKELEDKWQNQKDKIIKEKQVLSEYEHSVKGKVDELKILVNKQGLYEDAPIGKYFRTADGIIIKNVFELLDILKIMDDEVFKKHVNKKSNDFVTWIKNIIGDKDLAKKLAKVSSKNQIVSVIENTFAGK